MSQPQTNAEVVQPEKIDAPASPAHGSGSKQRQVSVPAYDDEESEQTYTELLNWKSRSQ